MVFSLLFNSTELLNPQSMNEKYLCEDTLAYLFKARKLVLYTCVTDITNESCNDPGGQARGDFTQVVTGVNFRNIKPDHIAFGADDF